MNELLTALQRLISKAISAKIDIVTYEASIKNSRIQIWSDILKNCYECNNHPDTREGAHMCVRQGAEVVINKPCNYGEQHRKIAIQNRLQTFVLWADEKFVQRAKQFVLWAEKFIQRAKKFVLWSETFVQRANKFVLWAEKFVLWANKFVLWAEKFIQRAENLCRGLISLYRGLISFYCEVISVY